MSKYTDNKHDPEYERGFSRGSWKTKHEATDAALAHDLESSAAFKRGWDDSRQQLTEWEAQEKADAKIKRVQMQADGKLKRTRTARQCRMAAKL
jgi:hypothetical protein